MQQNGNKKVFVAMSGGVDSSVAAMLLKNEGHEVVGVFMRCYNVDGCQDRDAEDARRVAEHLKIPFYVWDFEEEYKKRVVEYMVEGYRAGITPNPDVMCNREIKFGLFFDKALAAGADFIATGHYVKLVTSNSQLVNDDTKSPITNYQLHIARDLNKDQSYFLWTLTQAQLAYCLFPIGEYQKSDVRAMAKKAGLPTAEKKDSQGICFLGQVSIEDFLKGYIPSKRGALVTTKGEHIGEHFGAQFYTIGQRHIDADFKFPKTGGAAERRPFYVAAKDVVTNTVTLAEGDENEALYRREVELTALNFISPLFSYSRELDHGLKVLARVRYRQPLAKATLVTSNSQSVDSDSKLPVTNYQLLFSKPQKFVAAGQSAVFYSEHGEMLGGGIIL